MFRQRAGEEQTQANTRNDHVSNLFKTDVDYHLKLFCCTADILSVSTNLYRTLKLYKKKVVLRTASKEMPATTACIQDPKYFEQGVSDYSDVVPLLQKVQQDTEHTDFFVGYTFWSAKRKKAQTKL